MRRLNVVVQEIEAGGAGSAEVAAMQERLDAVLRDFEGGSVAEGAASRRIDELQAAVPDRYRSQSPFQCNIKEPQGQQSITSAGCLHLTG